MTGADRARWLGDWTGKYPSDPLAVVRPASTTEVSAVLALAHDSRTPVVPVSGLTGLVGGAQAGPGTIMLSLDRMNAIREIRPAERLAIVEAGVVLASLHAAAAEHDLIFPMTFGARGSCMIGGMLATNAGGSNVLRYGNTRDLTLGIEAVLADGRVVDLMSALHKDNSGLNLRQLLIGSEGTLGVITAAVMTLHPRPRAYATAMLAVRSLDDALGLLNQLQDETGGAVEAFEYMSRAHMDGHLAHIAGARPPFAAAHDVNVLVEIGATAGRDAAPLADGTAPLNALLERSLAPMLDDGRLRDATLAQSEAQRREMWARREAAAEIAFARKPVIDTDVCLPTASVARFLDLARAGAARVDPGCEDISVAHLGDGNVHYSVYPTRADPDLADRIVEAVEDVVLALGGSFSAEHGVGQSKLASMRRRKDPGALWAMRSVKDALDPRGILNPGKVYPGNVDPEAAPR